MKQKILAVLMIIAVLLCFMPTMAFADGETSASQIGPYYKADDQNSGALEATPSLDAGKTVKKYETQKIANGQVRIDKTIAGTGTENVFDVTLKVTTEDVDMQTVTSKDAAVVLVIDTSNSMAPNGNTSHENRIEKAKEAAQAFINNFADADSDAARKVAIVKFSGNYRDKDWRGDEIEGTGVNGAETIQGWTDAKNLQSKNGLCGSLAGLKADGGTNLAAGIQLAKNLLLNDSSVAGITNKNIVVLTDGAPTFGIDDISTENGTTSVCADGTNMNGSGKGTFSGKTEHDIHTQVEEIGTSLMQAGISPYAIFLGNEKLYCDAVTKWWGPIPTDRCDLDMSGRQWLATRCGFTAYAASNVEKLTDIFKKISELIKYQAQAWILTDPMGKYVDCLTQYTDDDANEGINFNTTTKELSWNLKQAKPTSTKDKQKTYELTYRIKLNNLAAGFQADTSYATNEPTSLTYLITNTDKETTDESPLKTAYFNVPSVKGLASRQWSFTKVDETNKPLAGAEFTLTADDDPSFVLTSTTSGEDGRIEFTNIPSGHTYTLKETKTPAGYAKADDSKVTVSYRNVTAPAIEGGELANQPATTSVSVTKVWNDNNNQDGKRPTSVDVSLYEVGQEIPNETKTLTADANGNWKATFENLPAARAGKQIEYTVKEDAVPDGYTASLTGSGTNFTITNTHTPETVSISGSKTWNDAGNTEKRPESITINLLADGIEVAEQPISANEEDGNRASWTFSNLPKYKNGAEIIYKITEDPVDNYTATVNGYDVTNTYTPNEKSVSVTKVWEDDNNRDGIRPTSVTIALLAGGELTGQEVTLSESNNWSDSFVIPTNDNNVYSVKEKPTSTEGTDETPVDGYLTTYSGNQNDGFVVTNTHGIDTTLVSVSKEWDDEGNEDKRPREITFKLRADGVVKESKTVTATDGWGCIFDNLPVNENGKEIDYTITEDSIQNYVANIEPIEPVEKTGFRVTNTYSPEIVEEYGWLQLGKIIEGFDKVPEGYSLTFTITGPDGSNQITYKASALNGLVGSLKLKAGDYTITESNAAISGYNCSTSYSINVNSARPSSVESEQSDQLRTGTGNVATFHVGADKFVVVNFTNSYTESGGYVPTPTPDVYPLTISKQVTGLDTVPADYAVTVTITNKYGTTARTITLKANETTTVYLPYGEYTLTETAPAVEGYTQSGQTFSENGFVLTYGGKSVTITNSYTKDADEPAVDPTPTDPATPAEPTKPEDNTNVPKTGDDMPISLAIYGIIAAGALLGIRKAAKRETK